MARILVVDDERSMRELLEILLSKAGHDVEVIGDGREALQRVAGEEYDLVITDLRLGKVTGIEILEAVKRFYPATEVVMITAFATADNAIEAMKAGAHDYVTKPFKVEKISVVVQKALEKRGLVKENALLRERLAGDRTSLAELTGASPVMRELYALIEKVAPTRSTILITGESGTGKELVARAIHARSPRAAANFVTVNCGAIPEGLMESELFGHERGAFTGAHGAKEGLFESGNGGTVFLDEIGELPLALQVKLLRVLQERKVKRVGGTRETNIDVRLIAATNRDLSEDVASGRFREDLFYRLNVIHLSAPPLRERGEDVLVLAETFLARFAEESGRALPTLSVEAKRALRAYGFPGNVRELQNLMERAATLVNDGEEIGVDLFPSEVAAVGPRAVPVVDIPEAGFDLEAHLNLIERAYLERALEASGGVKTEAARILGLTFRSFRYRLAKLGM